MGGVADDLAMRSFVVSMSLILPQLSRCCQIDQNSWYAVEGSNLRARGNAWLFGMGRMGVQNWGGTVPRVTKLSCHVIRD